MHVVETVVVNKAAAVVATSEPATTDAGANNAVLVDSTVVAAVPLSTAAPASLAAAVIVATAPVGFTAPFAVVRDASVAVDAAAPVVFTTLAAAVVVRDASVDAVTAVASLAVPHSRAEECRRAMCSNSFLSFMTATLQCGQRKASRSPT